MSQISKIISDISGGVNVLPDDLHDKCTTFEIDIDKIKQGTRNEFDSLLDGVNKKGRNTRIDCNEYLKPAYTTPSIWGRSARVRALQIPHLPGPRPTQSK
jgi:hypothetical protein